ncbi:SH3 domain-containing protein [Streptomyces sp. NPDC003656]|uniref:SH3 domain-containing protein n=1 Tax=unclassified Streptomyces TaxID=2593676 RepID=UPI0018F778F8|nr:SH3 domain-containing protein [Streptomyces sp. DSM 110735]MBJ7906726.1 SH3 domain-containing protein [Streptomyces sp. DSM 110735]
MTSPHRRSALLAAAAGALFLVTGLAAPANAAPSAATTAYPIAPGVSLDVRSGPGTGYGIIRVLPAGSSVQIYCQTTGTTVNGYYGTSNIWDNISSGQYVSDAYVHTGSDGYVAPRCA